MRSALRKMVMSPRLQRRRPNVDDTSPEQCGSINPLTAPTIVCKHGYLRREGLGAGGLCRRDLLWPAQRTHPAQLDAPTPDPWLGGTSRTARSLHRLCCQHRPPLRRGQQLRPCHWSLLDGGPHATRGRQNGLNRTTIMDRRTEWNAWPRNRRPVVPRPPRTDLPVLCTASTAVTKTLSRTVDRHQSRRSLAEKNRSSASQSYPHAAEHLWRQ
jgi:hypothetical protein